MSHHKPGLLASRFRYALFGSAAIGFMLGSASAQTQADRAGTEMFTGCSDGRILDRPNVAPRDTIMSAAGRSEPKSTLIFKSFSLDEAAGVEADEFEGECWSRLDGLWREQMRVSFDSSVAPEGWAALSPDLMNLAHGMYTMPVYIHVSDADGGNMLTLRSALGSGEPVLYRSADSILLEDVFAGDARSKTYKTEGFGQGAPRLVFDVSQSGYMRLKLGDRTFIRPKPEISEVARGDQVASSDLFAIAYNPKNLRANRQGYDVTRQDPNNFLDNGGLLDVFAPSLPRDYYVAEQMTVPLGLSLIPEGNKQGMVYFETLISSEYEYQQATQTSFGVNAGLTGKKGGPEGQKRYDPVSASVGYNNAREQSSSMKSKNSVATMNAYQRSKRYALVRDHAYSDLSDTFVDAIVDAYDTGNYLRVIETFGTHYPYAVTYGTAGRLRTFMTERTFAENQRSFRQNSASGGFSIGPLEAKASYDSSRELSSSNSVTNKYGETVFTAVGGNGSWDQNGFSAGDAPFPILTDMRTLDGLLSPIYFPDKPEIYETARIQLAAAIDDYLRNRPALSRDSRLASIRPLDEKQTYRIKLVNLECLRAGSWEGTNNPVQIHGVINIRFPRGSGVMGSEMKAYNTSFDENDDYAEITCPGGERVMRKEKAVREFTGTRAQLDQVSWQLHVNLWEWDWGADSWDGQEHIRNKPSGSFGVPNLNVGQKDPMHWDVPPADPGMPHLRINVEFERLS